MSMRRGDLNHVPSALFFLNALPVLMLATVVFVRFSLCVFHYFGAAKASQDAPQDRAMLDLVLGWIWDGFLIDFGTFLGGQNAPKMHPGVPQTGQDETFRASIFGSIVDVILGCDVRGIS